MSQYFGFLAIQESKATLKQICWSEKGQVDLIRGRSRQSIRFNGRNEELKTVLEYRSFSYYGSSTEDDYWNTAGLYTICIWMSPICKKCQCVSLNYLGNSNFLFLERTGQFWGVYKVKAQCPKCECCNLKTELN